ncbi:MAG: hypothetical protein A3C53_02300 [Omnitrophica WOR_2 bacterium RIFCSPHIGHO2_02_FULL_68_15]|nr:MAG: hypothetical protein A3C53_02300 [Omnitrophica WOR_2 bacterium RIFCSPHIGHO2_02_FULL_68_15]
MATHKNANGQTIVLAYVAVVVVTVLGGALLNHGFTTNRDAAVQQLQADVLYMAEGGLEDAIGRFANAIANFQIDPNVVQYPAAGVLTTTFTGGGSASSTVSEAEPSPRAVADPDGVSIFEKAYRVRATVQHPTGALSITLNQIVKRRIIYTFQHAVFYDGDLEWLPGPDMTLSGRVHSNGDIYLGTHAILTVDSQYLRTAGNLYNRRKDDPGAPMGGVVQIKKAGTNPAQFPTMSGLDSDDATWAADSQSRWGGTVKSGVHGVTARAVPVIGSIAPGGFYDQRADLKVINGQLVQGGVVLVEGRDLPPGTVMTADDFYNNRERKHVRMTTIDLRKLAGHFDANNDGVEDPPGRNGNRFTNRLPANGLLYANGRATPATHQPGVRLIRGAEIARAGGLTVVSPVPVYLQGDYNTVSKKPTAVIADAVNLLSNNWRDSTSLSGLERRPASSTTVNAAFIAGITETTPSRYNGGLENYPRFHENWTNKTLSITGSFVSLWNSQIATGNWVYGNPQYTAPLRNWNYDASFSSGTSLPPFTPYAVEMVKGAWWKE